LMEAQELITRYEAGERDFGWSNLYQTDLSGAVLSRAVLYHVNLGGTNLKRANLDRADLIGANLREANLVRADLTGAKVTSEQLGKAASLRGAAMPDGTVHE